MARDRSAVNSVPPLKRWDIVGRPWRDEGRMYRTGMVVGDRYLPPRSGSAGALPSRSQPSRLASESQWLAALSADRTLSKPVRRHALQFAREWESHYCPLEMRWNQMPKQRSSTRSPQTKR